MPATVLIVDDEVNVLNSLKRTLRGEGYEILSAASGQEALQILDQVDVSVIVCDYRMHGMSGVDILAEAVKLRPDAVRVMLSGHIDLRGAQASINAGSVSHLLLKPWDDHHLRSVIGQAAERFEMQREIQRLHAATERQRDELRAWDYRLEDRLSERTAAVHVAYDETVNALVLALDRREQETAGHSHRAAILCLYLALRAGLAHDDLEDLYRGAFLHDIGNIAVPDAVLLKPEPLSAQERRIIERHIPAGSEILKGINSLRPVLAIPRYHHEHYDGAGYCEGRAGDEIPIQARIFAVTDMYDALRSRRPYRGPLPHEDACELIAAARGTHFDPAIASAFLDVPADTWEALAAAAGYRMCFPDALAKCKAVLDDSFSGPAPVRNAFTAVAEY